MSSPTGLSASEKQVQSLRHRNSALQRWAASAEGVSFVDFDAMTRDMHHPPPCAHNVHWMCFLDWKQATSSFLLSIICLPRWLLSMLSSACTHACMEQACHFTTAWLMPQPDATLQDAKQALPAADENVLREERFGVPVSRVYTTEDGNCHDEM